MACVSTSVPSACRCVLVKQVVITKLVQRAQRGHPRVHAARERMSPRFVRPRALRCAVATRSRHARDRRGPSPPCEWFTSGRGLLRDPLAHWSRRTSGRRQLGGRAAVIGPCKPVWTGPSSLGQAKRLVVRRCETRRGERRPQRDEGCRDQWQQTVRSFWLPLSRLALVAIVANRVTPCSQSTLRIVRAAHCRNLHTSAPLAVSIHD